jgi:hypothetical protein
LKRWLLLLPWVLGAGVPMSAADVVWTRIHLDAKLDDDGRLRVIETHEMQVEKGGSKLFREFGLGADQVIAFRSLTRVDSDGSEHPLQDAEVGEDPGRYRYYDRGHAYYRIPEMKDGGALSFRFEYELLNAVAPAWGIGADPGPLPEGPQLLQPWRRLRTLLADWKEAWPDPRRRFRLDHDVLFPSRDGPGYHVRQMDYRLEYAGAWRRVHPEAELATVKNDDHYRVRVLFEYLGQGAPPAASTREAATRWASVAALPVVGTLLWLMLLGAEAFTMRSGGPVDRAFVAEHLLPLAPEEVARWTDQPVTPVGAETVLSRLASERKIAVEIAPQVDEESAPELRLRRLASPSSLPAFEREVLAPLFSEGAETTSERLREVHRKDGLDLDAVVRNGLAAAKLPTGKPRFSPIHVLTIPLGLLGLWLQLRFLSHTDFVFFVLVFNVLVLILARAWPRGWWYQGRPRRGLLVLPVLMTTAFLAFQFSVNRPLPAEAWAGGAILILACHATLLAQARMPATGAGLRVRRLARIRGFAAAELRRPDPRLEDEWNHRLIALGLGGDIERWRARFGDAGPVVPDLSAPEATGAPSGPRYRGRVPDPFPAPLGWTEPLRAYYDEDEEEEGAGEVS